MKKSLFLFLLLTLFVFQFNLSLRAQIFSEAPVTISDNGERLSNMIYVKFKSRDFVEIPIGRKNVDGNSISNKFSNIRKTIPILLIQQLRSAFQFHRRAKSN